MEMKRILCAIDLMDTINPAIEPAKMFAKLTGASLSVAYVLPSRSLHDIRVPVERESENLFGGPKASSRNDMMQAIWARAREDMDAFLQEHFPGMDAEGIVYEGRPAEKLVEIAEGIGADMIVMGTHAREGLDRLFFGSVAGEVVRTAKCYVLTTRPKEKAE